MLDQHRKTTLTAFTLLAMAASARGEATFEVSAFIVGVGGEDFVVDEASAKNAEWNFNQNGPGSVFHHDLTDAPLDYEDWSYGPQGGASHGRGMFEHLIADTVLRFSAGVEPVEYAESYAQVRGEYHLEIAADSTIAYDLCNDTQGLSTMGSLYIRKLVGGNFQTIVAHTSGSEQDLDCTSDVIGVQTGHYQVYFSAYVNIDDQQQGDDPWVFGSSNSAARLEIQPVPVAKPADINGDSIVDGADLAPVLASWG